MQNVVAVIFKTESEGFQAIKELSNCPYTDKAAIPQMALVKRTSEGFRICDAFDSSRDHTDDMCIGGLVGGMIGILGGPVGVLLLGSTGMLVGSMVDTDEAIGDAALIEKVAGKMIEGEVALIMLAEEEDESYLDAYLGKFDVEIARFDAAVIAEEIEQAALLQRDLEHQAKAHMRKEKKEERKAKQEAHRNKIKADFEAFKTKFKKNKKEDE